MARGALGIAAIACLAWLGGCAPSLENGSLGRFTATGFYNRVLPYRVTYERGSQTLIAGYRLENFVSVKRSRSRTVLEVPEDRKDELEVVLLSGGGAVYERRVHKQDLRLVQDRTRSTVWLSSIPLAGHLGGATLFELSGRYLTAIAGHGFPTSALGGGGEVVHRARVLSQRDVLVDGLKAFETTAELTHLAGTAEPKIARLLVVAPPFGWPVGLDTHRALMVLGYASPRAHFEAGLPAFQGFVNRVEIDYDAAVRLRTTQVLACAPASSSVAEVKLEVSAEGELESIQAMQPWLGTTSPSKYEPEQVAVARRQRLKHAKTCLDAALQGVSVAATGEARHARFTFDRAKPQSPRRGQDDYRAAGLDADPAPSATATAPPAEPAAPPPSPSTPAPARAEADAALRAALDTRAADLLACMGEQRTAIELTYDAGVLRVELREPLRNSPEQACVQQVLRDLGAPAGSGRIIHVLATPRVP